MIGFLGDYLYHGPRNPLNPGYDGPGTATLLNKITTPLVAVAGNCDSPVDQNMIDFPIEAPYSQIADGDRIFFLTHGHHFDREHLPQLGEGSVFVSGHTHLPLLERQGHIILLNPGSVSLPRGGSDKGYAMYHNNTLSLISFKKGIFQEMTL